MNLYAKLLKVKLLWVFMLFGLVPMALISLYSYYNIEKQLIASELTHLQAIAKLKSLQIVNYYNDCKNDLQTIESSPYTRELISSDADTSTSQYTHAKRLYEEQLNEFIASHNMNNVYIVRLDGKVIAKAQQSDKDTFTPHHELAFKEGKTKVFFSDVYEVTGNTPHEKYRLCASIPILDETNTLKGVLVAEFSVDDFFDLMQDTSGLGNSGETLLGKQNDHKVLFLNPLRHDPNAGMSRSVSIDGSIAKPVILGATGHNGMGISYDYRGVRVLAAWRYVPIAGWGMVAKIDLEEALKPLESVKNSILSTAFLLILIGIFASLKMTDTLIRPVENLETEAHTDLLTGLPNRKLLMGLLEKVLHKAKLKNSIVAVMFLDLDGFKGVNDTYGHEIGDLLLQDIAQRLSNALRQSDTIARLGGDEFVILLCGPQDTDNIRKIARGIIRTLNEEYSLNGIHLSIGVSIGISIYPYNSLNPDEMLRQADMAMYEAKKSGKNNFKFIDELPPV